MFGIERKNSTPPSRIKKRVKRAPTDDLNMWAEQVFTSTYQSFRSWQTTGDEAMLSEAALGGEALYEVLSELRRRNNAPLV